MPVGCDIIEIQRIREVYLKLGERFVQRILSEQEIRVFKKRNASVEFLAGRFAAKEAVAKYLGTGFRDGLTFAKIAIIPDEKGTLKVYVKNKLTNIELSISHCKDYAMAVCI